VLVITDQRLVDFKVVEKFLRLPRVFTSNHRGFLAQDSQSSQRYVLQISNGGRNQVQRGVQAISSVSLNSGSCENRREGRVSGLVFSRRSACIRNTFRQEGGQNRRIPNGYLHLEQDNSPYAIELNTELLPRLIAEISAGTRAGKEIGGLLVGSIPRAANIILRIDDFVVMARRESDEARYNLTPEQRARMSGARRELVEKRTAVLGFFRSHMRREGLALSSDDRKLLSVEFGKAVYTALLIRARSPHTAGFIIPDAEGGLPAGSAPKELQFDAEEATYFRQQAVLEVSPSKPHLARDTEKRETAPHQPDRAGIGGLLGWSAAFWAIWATSMLLMGLLLTAWAPFTTNVFGGSQGGLRLKATPRGNMLEIQWNRRQPDLLRAPSATLMIIDGNSRRELKLTPFELRAGQLSYQRKSDRITVAMSVQLAESAELLQSVRWPAR
jgi:hypothetical protein